MIYLIDTNIIIRLLVGDNEIQLKKSIEYFKKIETGELQVEILDGVLMEVYFVLTKFYKVNKIEVLKDLKTIISLKGVINSNKTTLFETFNILENKNIDFVDALICAKSFLEGYGKLSFDKDLKKC
jgi:predicted nucleic-acid-binding protein